MLSTHTVPGVNDIKATVLEVWGAGPFFTPPSAHGLTTAELCSAGRDSIGFETESLLLCLRMNPKSKSVTQIIVTAASHSVSDVFVATPRPSVPSPTKRDAAAR
jgi:hypothetical protein